MLGTWKLSSGCEPEKILTCSVDSPPGHPFLATNSGLPRIINFPFLSSSCLLFSGPFPAPSYSFEKKLNYYKRAILGDHYLKEDRERTERFKNGYLSVKEME